MVGQTVEKYPMSFMYIMLGISTGKHKFYMKKSFKIEIIE